MGAYGDHELVVKGIARKFTAGWFAYSSHTTPTRSRGLIEALWEQ